MIKASRYVYAVATWLFVVGVTLQVFLAGMVVVAGGMGWEAHRGLGHTLLLPLVFMLVAMYLGRLPRNLKTLTWVLFAVYALQVYVLINLRAQVPALAALHPVLALFDFALGYFLARRAWPLAQLAGSEPAGVGAPAATKA